MRAYEIEDRILKCEMAPQEKALLRMRQSFTHQAPDTLARGEVVTFDISRVDLLATKHLGDDVARTEAVTSAHLAHAALVRRMGHDAEMTRQGERTPHPGVTPVGRVTRLQRRWFFLTKLQSSSTCTCVGGTSRMKERLTAAPCCPARSNQCSVA